MLAIQQNHDNSNLLNFRKAYGNLGNAFEPASGTPYWSINHSIRFTTSACRQHANGTNYFCQSTKVDSVTFVGLQAINLLKYTSVIISLSYCFLKEPSLESNILLQYVQLIPHKQEHFFCPPLQKKPIVCTHQAQVQYKSEFITPYEDCASFLSINIFHQ
jgi:hypothetical protein